MDPREELTKFRVKFEPLLESYLKNKRREYAKVSSFTRNFFSDIAEFTLRGGKRLRPALLFHGYRLFGGNRDDEIIKLSIFIELIQSYLLIHDDIFDRSATRRKGPAFHKIYEKFSIENGWGDSAHFGTALGILAGDVAAQLANDVIVNSSFLESRKNKVIEIVNELTTNVLIGQIEDFILPFKNDYRERDIMKIHHYKTATYTFDMPLRSGSILAGVNDKDKNMDALRKYAKYAGIAFQIRDDILGIFGEEDKTGKPSNSDIKEGKKTLLVFKAEQNASRRQLSTIKDLLGKKNLIEKEANIFREIIVDTGSLEYSKIKCKQYVDKAKRSLEEIKQRNNSWDFLSGLADYLVMREV